VKPLKALTRSAEILEAYAQSFLEGSANVVNPRLPRHRWTYRFADDRDGRKCQKDYDEMRALAQTLRELAKL